MLLWHWKVGYDTEHGHAGRAFDRLRAFAVPHQARCWLVGMPVPAPPEPAGWAARGSGGGVDASAPPEPKAAPALDLKDLRMNAGFLVKREPPDPGHELYCQWLARQFYRDQIDDMIAAGFLARERAAELLGVEDTPS